MDLTCNMTDYTSTTRHDCYSGNICPVRSDLTGCPTGGITLVRLGEGKFPLQKLLHLMVFVCQTLTCGENEKGESPLCFNRHYFPSEWHIGLSASTIPTDGSLRGSKILLPKSPACFPKPNAWLSPIGYIYLSIRTSMF